jgi:hypothetical protein
MSKIGRGGTAFSDGKGGSGSQGGVGQAEVVADQGEVRAEVVADHLMVDETKLHPKASRVRERNLPVLSIERTLGSPRGEEVSSRGRGLHPIWPAVTVHPCKFEQPVLNLLCWIAELPRARFRAGERIADSVRPRTPMDSQRH